MVRERLTLHAAGVVIAALILSPMIEPGYVLSYDMNFVPAQPMRLDLIAPVDTAPRAVPLDAAVSLVNLVMPGWLLQRIVLFAIIWAAVVGAARLVPTESLFVRLIAGVGYGWTPFLAERLLIGQWALLIAYAALPWLVMGLQRHLAAATAVPHLAKGEQLRLAPPDQAPGQPPVRRAGSWAQIVLTAGLCALTPTGGVLAALTILIFAPWKHTPWWRVLPWRHLGIAVLVNLPWLVASIVTTARVTPDSAGVAAFAARGENWAGPIVALLGTGGIWNRETTPESRSSFVIPIVTVVLIALAIAGYRKMPGRLWIVAVLGLAIAMASTLHIGASVWIAENIPGSGLVRDSQKFVLPYALLLTVCVALGAERLAKRLAEPRVLLAGVLLLPLVALPDLAFGGMGALQPVRYPAEWNTVANAVAADPGPVLALPLSEYRRYRWNHDRVVIDPAPRYLPAPVLTDDRLVVGDLVLPGEDRRLDEIRARLTSGQPVATPFIKWVLVQGAVRPEALAGLEPVVVSGELSLYRNPSAVVTNPDTSRHLPVLLAEIAAFLAIAVAAVTMAVRARR